MHLYGIELITVCVIEIKISKIQLNASLNKRNQALLLHCRCDYYNIDCLDIKYT